MSGPLLKRGTGGFSLVEVMVALIVVSVGLLGLAKMEALAIASTTVAGNRSLAAIEAASLASMMHANQDFWQSTAVFTSVSISGTDPFPGQTDACTQAAPCVPQGMAEEDMNLWASALSLLLPGYSAQITCTPLTAIAPVSCTIGITWAENAVAINSQQTPTVMAGLNGPTYILYVQP